MRSIVLVPIVDPDSSHDAGLCANVSKEAHRLRFSRQCALLQGQVTSNTLEIYAGEYASDAPSGGRAALQCIISMNRQWASR